MGYKKIILTTEHCNEVLNSELLIGSDDTLDGKRKRFTYNPFDREYKIWINGKELDYDDYGLEYGMILDGMLDIYNGL